MFQNLNELKDFFLYFDLLAIALVKCTGFFLSYFIVEISVVKPLCIDMM